MILEINNYTDIGNGIYPKGHNIYIEWGDGTTQGDTIKEGTLLCSISHTYAEEGNILFLLLVMQTRSEYMAIL